MSSMSHLYRELGKNESGEDDAPALIEEDEVEDMQLASFDSGYKAGWEDALRIHEKSTETTEAELAQNLQDLAFTHHEVYLKFRSAMKPLFGLIIDKLLPSAAQQTLGLHILEQLESLMDSEVQSALEIVVSPENIEPLRVKLEDMAPVPFNLAADSMLKGGQALLRVGKQEREINLNAVLSGVSEAVDAFFEQSRQGVPDE